MSVNWLSLDWKFDIHWLLLLQALLEIKVWSIVREKRLLSITGDLKLWHLELIFMILLIVGK
jgi:hypothetical protein